MSGVLLILFSAFTMPTAAGPLDATFNSSTRWQGDASCCRQELSCVLQQRLLIREAWYGSFTSSRICSSSTNFCCQGEQSRRYSDTDLAWVSTACSARNTCSLDVRRRYLDSAFYFCGNRFTLWSTIYFSCYPEEVILTTREDSSALDVRSASLLLTSDTFSVQTPSGCCLLTPEHSQSTVSVHLYSYALIRSQGNDHWTVTVSDVKGHRYVLNASQPAIIRSSLLVEMLSTVAMTLPVTVDVHMQLGHRPHLVWIGFEAVNSSFSMRCGATCWTVDYTASTSTATSPRDVTYAFNEQQNQTSTVHYVTTSPKGDNFTEARKESHQNYSPSDSRSHDNDQTVGAVVGPLLGLLLLGGLVAVVMYKRQSGKKDNSHIADLPSLARVDDDGYCIPSVVIDSSHYNSPQVPNLHCQVTADPQREAEGTVVEDGCFTDYISSEDMDDESFDSDFDDIETDHQHFYANADLVSREIGDTYLNADLVSRETRDTHLDTDLVSRETRDTCLDTDLVSREIRESTKSRYSQCAAGSGDEQVYFELELSCQYSNCEGLAVPETNAGQPAVPQAQCQTAGYGSQQQHHFHVTSTLSLPTMQTPTLSMPTLQTPTLSLSTMQTPTLSLSTMQTPTLSLSTMQDTSLAVKLKRELQNFGRKMKGYLPWRGQQLAMTATDHCPATTCALTATTCALTTTTCALTTAVDCLPVQSLVPQFSVTAAPQFTGHNHSRRLPSIPGPLTASATCREEVKEGVYSFAQPLNLRAMQEVQQAAHTHTRTKNSAEITSPVSDSEDHLRGEVIVQQALNTTSSTDVIVQQALNTTSSTDLIVQQALNTTSSTDVIVQQALNTTSSTDVRARRLTTQASEMQGTTSESRYDVDSPGTTAQTRHHRDLHVPTGHHDLHAPTGEHVKAIWTISMEEPYRVNGDTSVCIQSDSLYYNLNTNPQQADC